MLAVALSLLACIRLYEEIAICIDRSGKGSSSTDVALIWQVAPVISLDIQRLGLVGRLPVLE